MPDWDREEFLESVDFEALVRFASSLRNGMPCHIVDEILGHNNLVYDIEFEDTSLWVARIQILPRLYGCAEQPISETVRKYLFESMVAAQTFARNKKSVFAPEIYTSFSGGDNPVGVPFMLMQKIDDLRLDEVIGHLPDKDLYTVFSDLAREMVSLASPHTSVRLVHYVKWEKTLKLVQWSPTLRCMMIRSNWTSVGHTIQWRTTSSPH